MPFLVRGSKSLVLVSVVCLSWAACVGVADGPLDESDPTGAGGSASVGTGGTGVSNGGSQGSAGTKATSSEGAAGTSSSGGTGGAAGRGGISTIYVGSGGGTR